MSKTEQNIHHLFTRKQIKMQLLYIYGNPIGDEAHKKLHDKIKKYHRSMPKFKIPLDIHRQLHNEQCNECGHVMYPDDRAERMFIEMIDLNNKIKHLKKSMRKLIDEFDEYAGR